MYQIRSTALFCLVVVLVVAALDSAHGRRPSGPCNVKRKCSDIEDVVWATDGNSCFVLRNDCYLKNANCERRNRNASDLDVVSKEECQKLCRPFCTLDFRPVCAYYNGVPRTFSNPCALSSHICLTGETYTLERDGACEAAPTQ